MDTLLHKRLNLLIHLAKVDGKFDQSERKLLVGLLHEHGLEESYLEKHGGPDLANAAELPDKKELFFWALKLIQADGIIHADERAYCKTIAIKLGYAPQLVDDLAEDFAMSYQSFEKHLG